MADTDDLVSISELSRQYHVDESVIRSWVKSGHLQFVMVNGRHLRKLRRSDVVKPIPADIKYLQQKGATDVGEGTADEVPVRTETSGLRQDEVAAGHTSLDEEIERRRWSTPGSSRAPKGRGRR